VSDHQHHIQLQYSQDVGAKFYRAVMGEGTPTIHYGIYEDAESTMQQATQRSTQAMLDIALTRTGHVFPREILDLGAGPGGSAHLLAKKTGGTVTCVDLCEHHNRENLSIARELGVAHQIHTWTGSFENLPPQWHESFDLVWSQEALCHAADFSRVLNQAYQSLHPGGMMIYSDILLAPSATEEDAEVFRRVNAVTHWRKPGDHISALVEAGFVDIEYHEWTHYLAENFRRMRAKIDEQWDALVLDGVPEETLQKFATSLDQRIAWPPGSVLAWGVFCCRRPS
jgi:sarcosine/dimethylglycine N-methyltransferase